MNKCQECGRHYKADIIIENDVWEKVKPIGKPKESGLLCGGCIIKKIENIYGYIAFDLVEITE